MDDPESARLLSAMSRCERFVDEWSGNVFRAVSVKYSKSHEILSGEGARRAGGRWNPVNAFAAVYASLDVETAMAETLAHVRHFGLPEHAIMPRLFVAIDVGLNNVLDLRLGEVRRILRVSQERMSDQDWRQSGDSGSAALTQTIGWAAHSVRLEGLITSSAARPKGANLVVFPGNLRKASHLRLRPSPEAR